MKFLSKVSNLRVVLKAGQPAEPLTGRASISGSYIKFEDGMVEIKDEEICNQLQSHPGFGSDFILSETDIYADTRKSKEPEHNIMELEHGNIKKNLTPRPTVTFTPKQKAAMKDMIKKEATKLAVEIAPELAKEMLKNVVAAKKAPVKRDKGEEKPEEDTKAGDDKDKKEPGTVAPKDTPKNTTAETTQKIEDKK